MTAWWKCCIPVSAWFVCIAVIAPKTYLRRRKNSKTFPGKSLLTQTLLLRDLITFPSPADGSVSERRPHATLAVCKHCVIPQKAFATWRRGSENSGRFGQLDVGAIQSARLGDSPLAAGQDTAVATLEPQKCLCHQASNDGRNLWCETSTNVCQTSSYWLYLPFRSHICCKLKNIQLTIITVT